MSYTGPDSETGFCFTEETKKLSVPIIVKHRVQIKFLDKYQINGCSVKNLEKCVGHKDQAWVHYLVAKIHISLNKCSTLTNIMIFAFGSNS